jgi:16S rRNA processing protein RimM
VPDQRHILIGRIVGAHGMAGGLKLASYAASIEVFAGGRALLAVSADGEETLYEVERAKAQGRSVLLSLKGVTRRSQAEALAGWDVFLDKTTLPPLEEGTYYWSDLIGVAVYAVDGRFLGRLESIFQTGSNDVYVVKHAGRELLLPALASVVQTVDLEARRMQVKVPEGLE